VQQGLISPDDPSYTVTDNLDVATEAITRFYQVYHSCRYVGDKLIRLKTNLSDVDVERLNTDFSDILVKGQVKKSDFTTRSPR